MSGGQVDEVRYFEMAWLTRTNLLGGVDQSEQCVPADDSLDLDQRVFYILPSSILNDRLPTQKTIALSTLLGLSPYHARYGDIAASIQNLTP